MNQYVLQRFKGGRGYTDFRNVWENIDSSSEYLEPEVWAFMIGSTGEHRVITVEAES